jgi:hypothetical protein
MLEQIWLILLISSGPHISGMITSDITKSKHSVSCTSFSACIGWPAAVDFITLVRKMPSSSPMTSIRAVFHPTLRFRSFTYPQAHTGTSRALLIPLLRISRRSGPTLHSRGTRGMNHMYNADMVRAVEAGRLGLPHVTGTVDLVLLSAHSVEVERSRLPHEICGMHMMTM